MRKNYNTIKLSIDNGLSDVKCGTAGDYIMLLEAPALANVKIKLNDQSADPIPLKAYHAIEAKDTDVIYVSADAIANDTITIVQAKSSNEFKMITPASDVNVANVESILNLDTLVLNSLDKIFNQYQYTSEEGSQLLSPTSLTLLHSETLSCDKIEIFLTGNAPSNGDFSGYIYALIDGVRFISISGLNSTNGRSINPYAQATLDNIKGKTIKIYGLVRDSARDISYLLKRYTLKP